MAALNPYHVTPYRVIVFATNTRTVGKGKRQRTETTGYGFQSWTPIQFFDAGPRLPGAGSFLYPGALRAIQAARKHLREPEVHQVQIRTNQDRKVLTYDKHADGRITFSANEE
jgi:hypothetical protein